MKRFCCQYWARNSLYACLLMIFQYQISQGHYLQPLGIALEILYCWFFYQGSARQQIEGDHEGMMVYSRGGSRKNERGGASRKGQSPVRGWRSHPGGRWVWEGEHPPFASPEAKCFAFYNLLTLLPLNYHINKWILNMKKLIQKTRSNQQKDVYCRCYIYIHALLQGT